MLRNDLINILSGHDNDSVGAKINGRIFDVRGVAASDGYLLLDLDLGEQADDNEADKAVGAVGEESTA